MGELSKLTGQYGENVVSQILDKIGWVNPTTNKDLACVFGEKHQTSDHHRRTHGMDFLVYKMDPLVEENVQNTVVISSKYVKYGSVQSKMREYMIDVAQTLECLVNDATYGAVRAADYIKEISYFGVIFWLSPDEQDDDLLEQLRSFRGVEMKYPVYVVDNRRANFLLDSIDYASRKFPTGQIQFFYPNTGLNIMRENSSGTKLPLQYINGSVLPFKIIEDNQEILLLTILEEFTEEAVESIIRLTDELTNGWANRVFIAYPDYHRAKHEQGVTEAKRRIRDEQYTSKVEVVSYHPDHRALEG